MMMANSERKRKSTKKHGESDDLWDAPVAEATETRDRKHTTPYSDDIANTTQPPTAVVQTRTEIQRLKERLAELEQGLASQRTREAKLLQKLDGIQKWNEELVAENIHLKTANEELERLMNALNFRVNKVMAAMARNELGHEDSEKFAKSLVRLANAFKEGDPSKVVAALRGPCPALLEALIDTISQINR